MADSAGPTNPANPESQGNKAEEPPKKIPFLLRNPFLLRTPTICAALLLTQLCLSLALFFISYKNYITWFKTTRHLTRTNDLIIHTTLFIATCAPLCSPLGVAVGAAYYWRKRCKYGKYDVKMRRKGRGYWFDPSDKDEKTMEGVAVGANRGARREMKRAEIVEEERREERERARARSGPGHISFALPAQPKKETKRMSFWSNPYGWVEKKKDERDEERGGGGGLGRSDTVRTCVSDGTVRRGVADIWGRKGSKLRGEDIEMVTRKS